MATRSTIALEYADGTIGQVYCHWDGYLEHNGAILRDNYMDPFKVRALLDLGDISSLGPELGEQHSFDIEAKYGTPEYNAEAERRRGITTFYGRDRGETGTNARSFKDYADYQRNAQFEEFNYILRRDGKWYVEYYGNFGELTERMADFAEEDAE